MLIKVLKPVETGLMISLAVLGYFDYLFGRNVAARVPGGKVESAYDVEKRRHYKTICRNTVNCRRPFSAAWLDSLWLTDPVRARNNHSRPNYAHYKAYFIKVVEIAVLDAVLRAHISD